RGAARFTREAFKIENNGSVSEELIFAHRAYVVGAITTSAAALEAMINEMFSDASEPDGGCIKTVSSDARKRLTALWEGQLKETTAPIPWKYQLAHLAITGRLIDPGDARLGKAQWVVSLRNSLIHFQPAWELHNAPPEHRSAKRRGPRFDKLKKEFTHN